MVDVVTARDARTDGSYVDWPCVLAGAVAAAAISFVLFTFGAGIGLSLVSPWPSEGVSTMTLLLLTAACAVLFQVGSFTIGGYIAGRMRRPWRDAVPSESEFRNGVHGLLVWGAGILLGALIAAMSATGLAGAGAQAVASLTGQADDTRLGYTDTLFRPGQPGQEAANANVRAEAGRLLATSATRAGLSDDDRTYLNQLVAANTGLTAEQAQQRVDQTIATARSAAEQARKAGILAAFLAAASLLVSAAAAWTAARIGGEHREKGTVWGWFGRRPRRVARA